MCVCVCVEKGDRNTERERELQQLLHREPNRFCRNHGKECYKEDAAAQLRGSGSLFFTAPLRSEDTAVRATAPGRASARTDRTEHFLITFGVSEEQTL